MRGRRRSNTFQPEEDQLMKAVMAPFLLRSLALEVQMPELLRSQR